MILCERVLDVRVTIFLHQYREASIVISRGCGVLRLLLSELILERISCFLMRSWQVNDHLSWWRDFCNVVILCTYADHLLWILRASTECSNTWLQSLLSCSSTISQRLWWWRQVLLCKLAVKIVAISSYSCCDVTLSFIWRLLVVVIEAGCIRRRLELLQVEHWYLPFNLWVVVLLEIAYWFATWGQLLCAFSLLSPLFLASIDCADVDRFYLRYVGVVKLDVLLRVLLQVFVVVISSHVTMMSWWLGRWRRWFGHDYLLYLLNQVVLGDLLQLRCYNRHHQRRLWVVFCADQLWWATNVALSKDRVVNEVSAWLENICLWGCWALKRYYDLGVGVLQCLDAFLVVLDDRD